MSKYVGKIITNQAPAGYSVFFDGTGDYLSVADNAALDMGGADFTIEFWTYLVGTPSTYQAYFAKRANTATYGGVELYLTSGRTLNLQATLNGSSWGCDITTTSTVPLNTWTHVAAVRNGNTWVVYVNGTAGATSGTVSGTVPDNANAFVIGAGASDGGHVMVASYISNFRVVKGTALYTAAFTPPTQLLNVTNTSLLTCNSPAIVDQSSNAFAITVNGNAAVSTFTPFTAYVPYNPALGASTPGVWTLDEAMQAAATRQWNMYDPYFQNTTLLLHGNGTNAAQNNTFLDSSSNNFTITRNGNTTQGSFSPFSQTGWSNFFTAASSQNISTVSAASTAPGTGSFCAELWYYTTSTANQALFGNLESNTDTQWAIVFASGNTIRIQGWFTIFVSGNSGPINQWNHVAVCRSGTTMSIFVNGVRVGTATVSNDFSSTSNIRVGGPNGVDYFNGYISNARFVKGSSVYDPTQASITVPTAPLTAITNTQFLTCQNNRFVDNSTNNFTLTLSGTPSVQAFSPFYPTAAYTPATIGGSGYFDGTGDYLTSATNTALQLGSSDFSIEWWEYRTALNNVDTAIVCGDGTFNALLGYYNSGFPRFYLSTTGSSWNVFSDAATGAIAANSWNHFVLTRSGTAFRVFLNGVLSIYATGSGSVTQTTNQIFISGGINGSSVPIEGYMAGVRFVKGSIPTSYQTSSTTTNTSIFTPPTTPVTTTSQGATSGDVKYLVNFTNAGIVDSTAKNVLETVGNAQISTTQSKFGGSSMSFNGTNSYLTYLGNNISYMGGGSWTVEMWLYPNSVSSLQGLLSFGSGTWRFFLDGSRLWYLNSSSSIAASASSLIATGQWYHIALVKNGTAITIYLNGSSVATGTDSNTYSTGTPTIGSEGAGSYLNGFIDDFRITKFARYTGNFTPQTSQWQDQ